MNSILSMHLGSLLWPMVIIVLIGLVGCAHFKNEVTPELLDKGYTIVLPGIEGKSRANSNIAVGLRQGGVEGAIEVVDWTTGHLPLFLVHLRHLNRNRRVAGEIADQIIQYQDEHPGRPVHLVGHSGGGGMISQILDQLPDDRVVTTATLIAPALSYGYPIHEVVHRTTAGIWHHHSLIDFPVLVLGTTVAGTFDGRHGPSAGALGFREHHPDLHQIGYQFRMLKDRHPGGHFGCTDPVYVRRWIAPVLVGAEQGSVPDLPAPDRKLTR